MDTPAALLKDSEDKMKKTLDVMGQNFSGLRSGRASSGMVENIRVDYYGTPMPLKQIANITMPEPKVLLIHPWDANALKPIEKAILESDLGISPVVDGKMIRLVVPPLTRERREEMAKIVKKNAEEARVALRAIRRDANERVKQIEKEKKITEDDSFKTQTDIQKLTDRFIHSVDQAQELKEKEFLQG